MKQKFLGTVHLQYEIMFSTNLRGIIKILKNLKTEKTTFRGKSAFSVNNEASDRPTYGQGDLPTDKVNYRDSLAVLQQYIHMFLHIFLGVRWMRAKKMTR